MFSPTDLIVAPATVPGPGLRGIVRLAGDQLCGLVERLVELEPPGLAGQGSAPGLVHGRLADRLADAWGPVEIAMLYWPGPGGPVGGPLAELQLPASAPLMAEVITAACSLGGRLARGGEFTLRAFLAGRLDLVQAEAVVSVVDAQSPDELARGLDRLAGGAGVALQSVREMLLDLVADVEAAIDFADETTPDGVPAAASWPRVAQRITECDAALAAVAAGLEARDVAAADLPRVVLLGPPNIGKSSLFNALAGRELALVADERGTTRDWLEARVCDEKGACVVVDLPGMIEPGVEAPTPVAAAAAEQARRQVERAAVVVICHETGAPPWPQAEAFAGPRLVVETRCDRVSLSPAVASDRTSIKTSAVTGEGIDELLERILATVAGLPARGSPATVRLAVGCHSARTELAAAGMAIDFGRGDEAVIASHLRRASEAVSDVTGVALGTDLLDRIFSRHCIGK
jgi:tRNA modification GTPase